MAGLPQGAGQNKRLMRPLVTFGDHVGRMQQKGKRDQAMTAALERGDPFAEVSTRDGKVEDQMPWNRRWKKKLGYSEDEVNRNLAPNTVVGGGGGEGRRVG